MSNWHDGLTPEDRAKVETAAKAAYENKCDADDRYVWAELDAKIKDKFLADQLAALRAIGVIAERDVGMEIAQECIWQNGADVCVKAGNGLVDKYLWINADANCAKEIVASTRKYLAARINAALKEAKEKP